MLTRHLKILPIMIGLCLVLAACGQSGDLYLPAPQQADTARQPAPPEQPETPEQKER
jgi:predicted small lipoprotein YifL